MTPSRSSIAILILSLALASGAAHARTVQRQIAAKPHGEVHISNVAGRIVIRGWDKPAVSVTADLTSSRQRVVLTSRNGRTRVCVTNGAASCNWWHSSHRARRARLEVRVPSASEIDASGVSAGISSEGIAGVQHLQTVSGGIDAALGSGDDVVKSVTGSIDVRGSGRAGRLRLANVSGDVSARDVAGELDARTVNGRLTAALSSARIVRLHTVSGAIELNAHLTGDGTVDTQTVSADQHIKVIAPAGFTYEVKTFSGRIEDCFGRQATHNPYGPGSRLEGTRGAGGGHVRIKSLSGSVTVCDQ